MSNDYIVVNQSKPLRGRAELFGAKNAALVIMASLLLTRGKSRLKNLPSSADVLQMIALLEDLGAQVIFDRLTNTLDVDTSNINSYEVCPDIMNKMRASILVMGPLLAYFNKARVALPGGCLIGSRPIDIHIRGFRNLGVKVVQDGEYLSATANVRDCKRIVLEYPSVGATENLLMYAVKQDCSTTIVNAALEPEVLDLIKVLQKMGADITVQPGATIYVQGVSELKPIEHEVLCDRLEAGALLLATAITGGEISLPQARAYDMDLFLDKLKEMGHHIAIGGNGIGISLKATAKPRSVSFKTGPHPCFPTDLQAPMMVAQCLAEGKSVIEETVFENRFMHVAQLQKMGAQISVDGTRATVLGVDELYGTDVIATDIRASCALVLAGLVANNKTRVIGLHHWKRGYDRLEEKLMLLGAKLKMLDNVPTVSKVKDKTVSSSRSA